MREYLRWVFKQFYLFVFWPSKFYEDRETHFSEDTSYRYYFKLLPFTVTLSVLGAIMLASAFSAVGFGVNWPKFWFSLPFGVAVGTLVGMMAGILIGILGVVRVRVRAVAGGVAGGVAGTVVFAVVFGVTGYVAVSGVVTGVLGGIASGLVSGMVGGRSYGSLFGVVFGVAGGIAIGVVGGIAGGLASGVVGGRWLSSLFGFGVAAGVAFLLCFWLTYFRVPWFIVDEGLARLARRRLGRGRSARDLWRWHPLRWNEVIWLPLQGAGAFLAALVREDRDYGFQQLVFVAIERPLQRQAVADALLEIAKDDLRCPALADFTKVSERLAWTTGIGPAVPDVMKDVNCPHCENAVSIAPFLLGMPDVLKVHLPTFDRVAQHAAQAHTVTSAFRRCEVLNTALGELRTLQLGLATAMEHRRPGARPPSFRARFSSPGRLSALLERGKQASEFLKVTTAWETLLRAERDKATALVTAASLPNPFEFGTPVKETDHNRFTGRRDVLQEIERALLGSETPPALLLLGARRMGKSSLLNQLPRLLGPDYAPAVVDAQGANSNSLPALAHAIAREVSEALRRRRVEPPAVDRVAFERDPLRALDDWVRAVEARLPGKLRVLLCLDEYERLEAAVQAGWGGPFLDQIRHILQHHPRFGLMFTGARPLRALGPAWTDRFISVRPLRVSFLREEDMRMLLTKPIPEFDLDYRPGALERLMDLTRGQPSLTQCVASELVFCLNAANRKFAEPADVDAAATKALETGDAYFANLWSDAGPDGQAALRALLQTGTPPTSGPVRTLLRELEILTDEGQFAVPLVRRWVELEMAKGN